MKKIFLMLVLIFYILTISAVCYAEEEGVILSNLNLYYESIPDIYGASALAETDEETLEDVLVKGLLSLEKRIDVSAFDITPEKFDERLNSLMFKDYRLYHVGEVVVEEISEQEYGSGIFPGRRLYNVDTGKMVYFEPAYTVDSVSELQATISAMDKEIEEYLALITPGMTNIEKLMTIHNKMVLDCAYEVPQNQYNVLTKYWAKNVFIDKEAVCQGYAEAFYTILKRLGIPVGFVSSNEINHIWNIVYLDGNLYHIDVTWDDPTYNVGDFYGRISYDNFLKSNEYFLSENSEHYGFTAISGADNKKYDDAFWNKVYSPMVIKANNWYFTGGAGIGKYNSISGETILIHKENGYKLNCMGLGYSDGRLYFNNHTEVLSIDLEGNNLKKIYGEDNGEYGIYGLFIEDGKIKFASGAYNPENLTVLSKESLDINSSDGVKKCFIIDDFIKDGNRYISFVNNSGITIFDMYAAQTLEDGSMRASRKRIADRESSTVVFPDMGGEKVFVWDVQMRPVNKAS